MKKYNDAVEKAQKAVEDVNTAKSTYADKKQAVADAEKAFYDKIDEANRVSEQESQLITDPSHEAVVSDDKLPGTPDIASSITIDESGASISDSPISVETQPTPSDTSSENIIITDTGTVDTQPATPQGQSEPVQTVVTEQPEPQAQPSGGTAGSIPISDTSVQIITPTESTPTQETSNGGIIENQIVSEEYINESGLPVIDANGGNTNI